jgi:hypothetical protein
METVRPDVALCPRTGRLPSWAAGLLVGKSASANA